MRLSANRTNDLTVYAQEFGIVRNLGQNASREPKLTHKST